tara:strand:+ start:142 stop:798 length:657 start_codon:yes stop_codon:yes gene_type:complete
MNLFYEDEKENIKLFNLFSIPMMSFHYGEISEDEFNTFDRYLNNVVENKFNYTSKENYFLDKELPLLRRFFEKSINTYSKKVLGVDTQDLNYRITQSWINICSPNASHHQHTHPNSFISGVFYIKVNSGSDKITFINEFMQKKEIKIEKGVEFNSFNASEWSHYVRKGELILFPSNLTHYVPPVEGESDRISLSFNVFPYGILGSEENLTHLRLPNDK